MKFNSYSDPGHGWAKVPRKLLHKLGIAEQITPYSYQRGEWVYLEEDCDLSLFMKHCPEATFRHYTADKSSRIRNYERYQK